MPAEMWLIPWLLTIAWLCPVVGFVGAALAIVTGWSHRLSRASGWLSVSCIVISTACSLTALVLAEPWSPATTDSSIAPRLAEPTPTAAAPAAAHAPAHSSHAHTVASVPRPLVSGVYYQLAQFGPLSLSIDYFIDGLTLILVSMVAVIATLIHLFAISYLQDELTEEYEDPMASDAAGLPVARAGRFHRFFACLSLFCWAMFGLLLAGNLLQIFVFWELVGFCSYLLIGFYYERPAAIRAANKAFLMNRVGDVGFLIGLMILWTSLGTLRLSDYPAAAPGSAGPLTATPNSEAITLEGPSETAHPAVVRVEPGLFQLLRGEMTDWALSAEGTHVVLHGPTPLQRWLPAAGRTAAERERTTGGDTISYALLVAAGLGLFAGCVGKSAQFPLQTWLPDAMEGPTPVSALVHSATMVAAGVYLAARLSPLFLPEVHLVIALVGGTTILIGALIAVVATDIKRVLAFSTISQLGYMLLAVGVGGAAVGLFHLVTHAFFKALLFLGAGSVIVACHHQQDLRRLGGLARRMPITAVTMLVGVIAITGLAIPGLTIGGEPLAFSGYHSKDAILAQTLAFSIKNGGYNFLFWIPVLSAGLTAFYMFRLWFLTFLGTPRDPHLAESVSENGPLMTVPLAILAAGAMFIAVGGEAGPLFRGIAAATPGPGSVVTAGSSSPLAGTISELSVADDPPLKTATGTLAVSSRNFFRPQWPTHSEVAAVHGSAGAIGLLAALAGLLAAYAIYARRWIDATDLAALLAPLRRLLLDQFRFDALYDNLFVRPLHKLAQLCFRLDQRWLDGLLHQTAAAAVVIARWDRWFDEGVVDATVETVGTTGQQLGALAPGIQTGRIRDYLLWIGMGVAALFVALVAAFPP